jgi:hypothetical protein
MGKIEKNLEDRISPMFIKLMVGYVSIFMRFSCIDLFANTLNMDPPNSNIELLESFHLVERTYQVKLGMKNEVLK